MSKDTHMTLQDIGVIGAGTMGNGIAQVCAVAGFQVTLIDIAQSALQRPWPPSARTLIARWPRAA